VQKTKLAVERLEDRVTPVTFGNPTGYAAGSNAQAIGLGDVDNDGDIDLAVAAATAARSSS
jgi:hypothetical protein